MIGFDREVRTQICFNVWGRLCSFMANANAAEARMLDWRSDVGLSWTATR